MWEKRDGCISVCFGSLTTHRHTLSMWGPGSGVPEQRRCFHPLRTHSSAFTSCSHITWHQQYHVSLCNFIRVCVCVLICLRTLKRWIKDDLILEFTVLKEEKLCNVSLQYEPHIHLSAQYEAWHEAAPVTSRQDKTSAAHSWRHHVLLASR